MTRFISPTEISSKSPYKFLLPKNETLYLSHENLIIKWDISPPDNTAVKMGPLKCDHGMNFGQAFPRQEQTVI